MIKEENSEVRMNVDNAKGLDVSNFSSMHKIFDNAKSLNPPSDSDFKEKNLGWDVSNLSSINKLFGNEESFNIPIDINKKNILDEKIKLAKDPNTLKDILKILSKEENWEVKMFVAKNPNTTIETLIELSKDEDSIARKGVAGNLNTPKDILIELSKDKNWEVRWEVAGNRNTPKDVLTTLSKDGNKYVIDRVARNSNTPIDVLNSLIKLYAYDRHIPEYATQTLNEINRPSIIENKIEKIESKISNIKSALDELFKEKNIDPNSEMGLEILKIYNDTHDELKLELEELKAEEVDIATNDFLER